MSLILILHTDVHTFIVLSEPVLQVHWLKPQGDVEGATTSIMRTLCNGKSFDNALVMRHSGGNRDV